MNSGPTSNAEKAEAYIRHLLAGLTPIDLDELPEFSNVKTGISDPPGYVLRLLLIGLLRFPDLGPDEKVRWQTVFRFKGQDFLVRDFKFDTWTIEAAMPDQAKPLVVELEGRLRGAAGKLDAALIDELRGEVKAERYWLVNSFFRLNALYEDYRERTRASVAAFDEIKDQPGKGIEVYNARIRAQARAAHDAFGLLGAFFSLLEFLLLGMYALHRSVGAFADFEALSVDDQLRELLPTTTDKEWDKIYNRVIQLRKSYRNPLHHGLSDEEVGVLVEARGVGLVPLSYRYLADRLRFGYSLGVEIDEVRAMLATSEDLLEAVQGRDPYHYYFAYLKGGFPIPIRLDEAAKVRRYMTSHREFAVYVSDRERHEDDLINRDI